MRVRPLLREPLVHFLLLGALLFVIDGVFGGSGRPEDDTIVVTEAQVDAHIEQFQLQWQRPPAPQELRGLVDAFVREEIMYREALAMGLDRDDTVVRRRMMQKLEFLTQALIDADPSDAELAAFFAAQPEQFMLPAEIGFAQVYLNPDKRGGDLDRDAILLLDRLRASPDTPIEELGDSLLLQARYQRETHQGVASLFGAGFAEAIFGLPLATWSGPIDSGYGVHLVRVEARSEPRLPAFGAVRDRVRNEYLAQARRDADERMYSQLRSRYQVIYDFAEPTPEPQAQ